MESSKLVFVSLKDARPKRKVAVPIPDGTSWDEFLQQVRAKLKLASVGRITLSSSGEAVHSLDALDDIDELLVEEASGPATSPAGLMNRQSAFADGRPSSGISASTRTPVGHKGDSDEQDKKYIKRTNPLRRFMQKIFPSIFEPSLPVTRQEADGGAAGDRGGVAKRSSVVRRKRPTEFRLDPRTLLIVFLAMSTIGMMVVMSFRMPTVA